MEITRALAWKARCVVIMLENSRAMSTLESSREPDAMRPMPEDPGALAFLRISVAPALSVVIPAGLAVMVAKLAGQAATLEKLVRQAATVAKRAKPAAVIKT